MTSPFDATLAEMETGLVLDPITQAYGRSIAPSRQSTPTRSHSSPYGLRKNTGAQGDDVDMAAPAAASSSSQSARAPPIQAASSATFATPSSQAVTECMGFITPRIGSFKALLAKKSKLEATLASLTFTQQQGSIPKALQIADLSSQIPATQPELREAMKRKKAETEKDSLQTFINSNTKELDRVDAAITGFFIKTTVEFKAYAELGSDIPLGPSMDQRSIGIAINNLLSHFKTLLQSQILLALRTHGVISAQAAAKRKEQEEKRNEQKEEIDNKPELSVAQLVQLELNKALKKLKSPPPPRQQNRNAKQPQQQQQQQKRNTQKKKNPSNQGNNNPSNKKKQVAFQPNPKNGNGNRPQNRGKDADSGNQNHQNRNSGNGPNKPRGRSRKK